MRRHFNPRSFRPRDRRAAQAWVVALFAVLLLLAPVARAQEPEAESAVASSQQQELRGNVLETYDVVILSRGLLLEPLDEEADFRVLEVTAEGLALDGEEITEEELFDRLGEEQAELIVGLSELEVSELRVLFQGVGFDVPEAERTIEATVRIEVEDSDEDTAEPTEKTHKKDSQVIIGSSLTVDEDEIARDVLVIGGQLEVLGEVIGDAVTIGGPLRVSGEVSGDAAAIGGSVYLESGALVSGDAVSVGGTVEREDDVTVKGQVTEVPFGPSLKFGAFPWSSLWRDRDLEEIDHAWRFSPMRVAMGAFWKIFGMVILALLACLALLLARNPVARMERRVVAEPWKSGLVGLVAQILFLPLLILVVVVLAVSIIGIPLLLLVPFAVFALVVIGFLGLVAVAHRLGQILQQRFGWKIDSPYLVVALGVVTIQIWGVIGSLFDVGWGPLKFVAVMFFLFSAIVKYVAWTVGFGAALLTRFGTSETWGGAASAPLPAAPSTPMEGEAEDFGWAEEEPSAPAPDEEAE